MLDANLESQGQQEKESSTYLKVVLPGFLVKEAVKHEKLMRVQVTRVNSILIDISYTPQFLVLTGPPSSRPDLTYFFHQVSHSSCTMICGQVLLVSKTGLSSILCNSITFQGEYTTNRRILLSTQQRKWLRSKKVKLLRPFIDVFNVCYRSRHSITL